MKERLNKITAKVKSVFNRIRNFFPSPLPQGLAEFNEYVDSIIATYNPPMDARSVKFVIATLMMRLDPTDAYKPKRYFALCLHKGAASEVSAYVMGELKAQQAAEAAAQKAQSEATANAEASDVKSIQN